jgi:hypothetical protein
MRPSRGIGTVAFAIETRSTKEAGWAAGEEIF